MVGMVVLALAVTAETSASPLYGGYNGGSEAWLEGYVVETRDLLFSLKISIGIDSTLTHLWVKAGVSSLFLVPYNISGVGLSYETGNIVSASADIILPWPYQVGADTNNLVWFVTSLLVGVSGMDSKGNLWWEVGIPGVAACGEANQEDQWCWLKILPVLFGMKVDFPFEQGFFLSDENSRIWEEELQSLQGHFSGEDTRTFCRMLKEKLTNEDIMRTMGELSEAVHNKITLPPATLFVQEGEQQLYPGDPLEGVTTELNVLLTYVEDEIFTQEIRDEMDMLLDDLARDVKPHLETMKRLVK